MYNGIDINENHNHNKNSKDIRFKKRLIIGIIISALIIILGIIISVISIRTMRINSVKKYIITSYDTGDGFSNGMTDASGGTLKTYYFWQECNYESEIKFFDNDWDGNNETKPKSTIYRFASSRNFEWEINDSLELKISFTLAEDKPVVYSYSNSVDDRTWHFDDNTHLLYIGNRKYQPMDPNKSRYGVY